MHEFEIIEHYFEKPAIKNSDLVLGIGDDAAIITPPHDQQLLVCVDTIVEGIHFLPDTPAACIAHLALAVNLSDIAAMGGVPKWFTLALTLPNQNTEWLSEFSRGLFALANEYQVSLIGGDTTRGPLTITIQVLGTVPKNTALTRHGAQVGDRIYVSGTVGDSALGLAMLQKSIAVIPEYQAYLRKRYEQPQPQLLLGQKLRGIATSAIDISDGLAQDLKHILTQSHVGARIKAPFLPLSIALKESVSASQAFLFALSGGDDYELCFTVPPADEEAVNKIAQECHVKCTCIGEIVKGSDLEIFDEQDHQVHINKYGWEHF